MVRTYLALISWLLMGLMNTSSAQILNDQATQQIILQALDKSYNLDFKEAEVLANKVKQKYPNHPATSLLPAISLYWQYLPLKDHLQEQEIYRGLMRKTISQAEALDSKYSIEATFFALAAHSYLAMNEADNENTFKAVGHSKDAYKYMKHGMALIERNPEFYFSTGLFNYYIEQYPEDHSVVKPFMFFFQKGDKKLGLQQLEIGAKKAFFTRTEAAYYTVYINIKHENNMAKAYQYIRDLNEKYPANQLYQTRLAEVLILQGRYKDAEPLVKHITSSPIKVFAQSGLVFEGIIIEKLHHNDAQAKVYYQKALQIAPPDKRFTENYFAMAYCGLARIAHRKGDITATKANYKKALTMTEYPIIKIEASKAL
jgi:predicted Zn-dependent protease